MYPKLLEESMQSIKQNIGKPFYVYISLSNICNANCVFCNVHDESSKHGKINTPQLIDELKLLGTRYVHFIGGGEPFTEKQIWDYFRQISGHGMNIAITTNGLALDYDKIHELSQYNVSHIFFSLDSHLAGVHDSLRRVPGLWDKVTANIRIIKEIKPQIKIIINHLLNEKNIRDFESMLRLKESVPYDYINPLLIKDCPPLSFSKEQILWHTNNLDCYYQVAQNSGVQFLYDDINFFEEVNSARQGVYHLKNFACYVPMLSAYIDCPSAQVFPCDCAIHRDPDFYRCGNLLEESFEAVWRGERMEKLRQELEKNITSCKNNCDAANIFFNKRIGKGGY